MTKGASRTHEPMHLDAGRLGRVEFHWTGDRYRHLWRFPQAVESATQLVSVESTADAIWPISPPLQQVHLQSFDDGREVIFGVGMSGRGHWSASFTMVPELKGWIVEFACRSPLIPERLGCVYQRGSDWKDGPQGWQCSFGSTTLTLEAIAPSTLVPSAKDQLMLAPGALPTTTPSTTQWAYRMKVG
ncbi:MAG: hypothetical protein IT423_17440 [Pirellulaceae bacterium]|nr:hypothetical protein [Pirellulaceae bacterium]